MKQFITIFVIFICSYADSFATMQAGDLINFQGQKYTLYSLPLGMHPDFKILHDKIFSKVKQHANTSCLYQAEWEVKDNLLYLVAIRSCNSTMGTIHLDLKELFGDGFKNGRVLSNWVNDKLYIQQGNILHSDGGFGSIFQWEIELMVVNGKVVGTEHLDNTYTRKSVFTTQPDSLISFLHKRIKWNEMPDLQDKKVRINISLYTTGTLKPSVSLLTEKNDIFSSEALRVARLIPEWDVYYKRGKPLIKAFGITVIFSEENRKKYFQN